MFMMFLRLILITSLMRLGSLISLVLSLKMSRDFPSRGFQELLIIFLLKTPLHSNFRLSISSICTSRVRQRNNESFFQSQLHLGYGSSWHLKQPGSDNTVLDAKVRA